jgi:hypothetical protein
MAYGFGTTVNPQLGAVDYSNYLRGALSGAQMQAQGGAAIGAGVQNALAGIGEGIQKYQQNKILQSEIMGGVEENINFLVNNNPESIQNAPKAVQDVLRRMEDAKGVSLKDSAYLKSWLDSATKQAKDNIENNALVSALGSNPDGTDPTNQQRVTKYFGSGGRNQSLMAALLAFGKDPAQVDLLNAQIEGHGSSNILTKQQIEGNVPLTAYQRAQLEAQEEAPEGMRYTQEELNELKELGYDYEIISRNSDGSVQVSGVSPFAPEQSTMTDTERTVQARLKAIADSGQTVTPEIEADIRAQVRARGSMAGDPEQKARLDLISQELPVFAERAAAARDLLPGVVNIAQKLNTGLETGKMAPVVTFINGWANALGIPVDTEALADKEAGAAIFNQFMLEFLQKTKGSISERENALFQSMGPQFSNSIKANKELVALVAGRLNNDVNLGRIYQKGLAQQKPLSEILSEIETKGTEYEQKFLDELEDLAQSVIPIAPSRKPEISNFEAPSKYSPGEEVSVGSDLGNGFKLIN